MLSRHIATRIDYILITRAMELSSQAWRNCPSIFVLLSMAWLIQSSSHSQARLVITRVCLVGCSTFWHMSQFSVCTGYKKMHGHKMETVFFPNGISTCFGLVSAWQNDRGTLAISGLDCFLGLIQAHLPPHMQSMVFGDSAYCGNALQMVISYFRAIPPDVQLFSRLGAMLHSEQHACLLRKIVAFRAVCSCVQRLCDNRRRSSYGS